MQSTCPPLVPASPLLSRDLANDRLRQMLADLSAHHDRQLLARTLHLPALNRWVSDWLFNHANANFHPNLPLSLQNFQRARPLTIRHMFNLSHPVPDLLSEMLIVPVACLQSTVVGYVFTLTPSASTKPSTQCNVSRFVFHRPSAEFIMVANNYKPKQVVIMSFIQTPDLTYQYLFLCPSGEYSFSNLPNKVDAVQVSSRPASTPPLLTSTPLTSAASTAISSELSTLFSIFPEASFNQFAGMRADLDVPSLCSPHTTVSHLPWVVDSSSSISDNVSLSANPGPSATSSGAFDLRELSLSIEQINETMHGNYVSTEPLSNPTLSDTNIEIHVYMASSTAAHVLRTKATTLYIAESMPAVFDERILQTALLPRKVVLEARKTSEVGVKRIAPTPMVTQGTRQMGEKKTEDEARERMLEARRRRNRMSAARSNARRKEARRRNAEVLNVLKVREKSLRWKEKQLVDENLMLRGQLVDQAMVNVCSPSFDFASEFCM